MNNLLKTLIVWLMLVAIPFQGLASASMLTCAPMQPAPSTAMTPAHCADMAAMQADAPHAMAGHDMADMVSMATDAPAGHASPDHHAPGKCSTCASCSFGAAMAPSVAVAHVPAEMPDMADFQFDVGHVTAVDLALPERPPKASLT